jgi:CBS domain containing-hemolysin-like protein
MDELPLLFLLLILSGFFSGAEIAFFSIGQERISAALKTTKSKAKKRKIKRLELLLSDPNKLLVTILIGNNVVNIAASAIATVVATNFANANGFGDKTSLVVGSVTGVMTLLVLIFGEITPKAIAHKYAMQFAIFSTRILTTMQFILFPIIFPLARIIEKFSGNEKRRYGMNEEELKAAVEISEQEGTIEFDEKELVQKVLEFDEHTVEAIMTPRSKVFALEEKTKIKDAVIEIADKNFSRVPIFRERDDLKIEITGILTIHSLVDFLAKNKKLNSETIQNLSSKKPFKIPPTMKIDVLLRQFQKQKTHLACVLDEHGGLVGIITLEDVIEEIFGEFNDENDKSAPIKQIGKNKFWASAEIELEQIEKFLNEKTEQKIVTPWELDDENKSVAGFLLEKLERFPNDNEQKTIKKNGVKFIFKIKKSNEETIESVEINI